MRQQFNFTGGRRSQDRSSFTEAQILKFTRVRGQDDLTILLRSTPHVSAYTTMNDAHTIEPSDTPTLVKKVSA